MMGLDPQLLRMILLQLMQGGMMGPEMGAPTAPAEPLGLISPQPSQSTSLSPSGPRQLGTVSGGGGSAPSSQMTGHMTPSSQLSNPRVPSPGKKNKFEGDPWMKPDAYLNSTL